MKRIRLTGINAELLQSFRLMRALAEAGIPLAIGRPQVPRWKWMSNYFGEFDVKPSLMAEKFSDVEVDHHTPRTRIGTAEHLLVFHYEGFNYYRMNDPIEVMRWRPDWAESNQTLARKRVTIPHEELVTATIGKCRPTLPRRTS